jgi:hypothetical protein
VDEMIKKQAEDGRDFDWQEIFELFHKPKVKEVEIKFPKINENKIRDILSDRDFSDSRIDSGLSKLNDVKSKAAQRTLF